MLGHTVGTITQIYLDKICKETNLINHGVCTATAVFVHEFIVEPAVDLLTVSAVSYFYLPNAEGDHNHGFSWGRVASVAGGAVIVGQTLEHIVKSVMSADDSDADQDHGHGHNDGWCLHDAIEYGIAAISVVGGVAGGMLYDRFHPHTHEHDHQY